MLKVLSLVFFIIVLSCRVVQVCEVIYDHRYTWLGMSHCIWCNRRGPGADSVSRFTKVLRVLVVPPPVKLAFYHHASILPWLLLRYYIWEWGWGGMDLHWRMIYKLEKKVSMDRRPFAGATNHDPSHLLRAVWLHPDLARVCRHFRVEFRIDIKRFLLIFAFNRNLDQFQSIWKLQLDEWFSLVAMDLCVGNIFIF